MPSVYLVPDSEDRRMPEHENNSPYYVECDLATARPVPTREPAPHQKQALGNLHRWYESTSGHDGQAGGILVLPTGAGKTFTAVHFLCSRPLSDRHKVLWLAHTHHLLEQALHAFCRGIGRVAEPREQINIRVVSGTTGHFPPRPHQARRRRRDLLPADRDASRRERAPGPDGLPRCGRGGVVRRVRRGAPRPRRPPTGSCSTAFASTVRASRCWD